MTVGKKEKLCYTGLTEEGREINANAAVERIELENRIRDGLSDEEFHTLMHLLKRVADNMLEE